MPNPKSSIDIDSLSPTEKSVIVFLLSDEHPRIYDELARRAQESTAHDEKRRAMPPHPYTRALHAPAAVLCYHQTEPGLWCLRGEHDPLHVGPEGSDRG